MDLQDAVEMTLLTISPLFVSSLFYAPLFTFWSPPFPPRLTLSLHQAIPSHGFHQFKSNSLDVLQRRNEEQQVCPSVCLRPSVCLLVHVSCPLLTSSSPSTKCMTNVSLIPSRVSESRSLSRRMVCPR